MPQFEPMNESHRKEVIDIFNYYVETTNAAFPAQNVGYESYDKFLENAKLLSGYAIKDDAGVVLGFCMLKPYNSNETFSGTVEVSYFIREDKTGMGFGKLALAKLEEDAKRLGKKHILATISGDNEKSINFHTKNRFIECGRFKRVGKKNGKEFDLVFMQKELK